MSSSAETYDYVDEEGEVLFRVERREGKRFRQCRPNGQGGWTYALRDVRRVLYRLPAVLGARERGDWIWLVEGEKDVHTLEGFGKVATTNPGGAGKWAESYTEALKGARVILVADGDKPGLAHALAVAEALEEAVGELRIYGPRPGGGKDVSEILADCSSPEEARRRLTEGLVRFDLRELRDDPDEAPRQPIRVISLEELMATPDPADQDFLLGPLLMKGSRVVIGAHTGEGKTTWGLAAVGAVLRAEEFLGWTGSGNGTRALVLDVEQGRKTVKRRFVEAGLHDLAGKIDLIHEPDGLALDSDERHATEVESILASGRYDLVFADPLYKLHRGDANDERRAVDLMRLFDSWRERYGFALILPMHCRKPQPGQNGKLTIHDILGSSGYTRGAEVVVGLQRVSNGYSFLYWFKDREGDLGCLHERWGLLFDQARGFRRDPRDLDRTPVRERVRASLFERPGQTIDDLREVAGVKHATIRKALEDIGALEDGARLLADKRWSLPASLFDGQGELAGAL